MKIETFFSNLAGWLSTTEMFARASRQIPGKWHLYEYYSEPADELIHINENQLKKENQYWEIDFTQNDRLVQKTNIRLPFQNNTDELIWGKSGLHIIFTDPSDSSEKIKFRFAVSKEGLKLLKKDSTGRIEFFGFFKRPDS
jgi:hypothetical protein